MPMHQRRALLHPGASPEDMAKISDSSEKSAIGYDEKRGDKVQVTNMQFAPVDMGLRRNAPKARQPLLRHRNSGRVVEAR